MDDSNTQPNPMFQSQKRFFHKKKFIVGAIITGVIVIIGAVLAVAYLLPKIPSTKDGDIVIGGTTITQQRLSNYTQAIDDFRKANPDAMLEGDSKAIASDDLIMNAALKQYATQYNQTVSNKEVLAEAYIEAASDQEADAIIDSKLGDALSLSRIRNENVAYQKKLAPYVLAMKSLFGMKITFDTPYFLGLPTDKIQAAYDSSIAKLSTEILPLFNEKQSKEEIAKKADVNLLESRVTDANDLRNSTGPLLRATFDEEYLADGQHYKKIEDSAGYVRGDVGQLYNMDEKMATLKDVGDFTDVFSAQTGEFAIVRLESKTDGKFNSWQEMLESFKKEYAYDSISSIVSDVSSGTQVFLEKTVKTIASIGVDKASAARCGGHEVNLVIRSLDVTNQMYFEGVRVNVNGQPKYSDYCPGFAVNENVTTTDTVHYTCYAREPTYTLLSAPDGYVFQGLSKPSWAEADINAGPPTVDVIFRFSRGGGPIVDPPGPIDSSDACDPISITVEPRTYPAVSHTAPNGQSYYYPQTTIPVRVSTPRQNPIGTYSSKTTVDITAANTTGDAYTVTYAETSNHVSSYTDVYRTVIDYGWIRQFAETPIVCPEDPEDETPCTGGEVYEIDPIWGVVGSHQVYDHTNTNYTGPASWASAIGPCYDYSLTANVSSNYAAVEADALVSVGASIGSATYTGRYHTHSRNAQWQLVKLIIQPNSPVPSLSNSNSWSDPCGRLSPYGSCSSIASGSTIVGTSVWSSAPVSQTIGDYPAGTKVCFALGVQPRAAWHLNHIDNQWNHSAFSLLGSCIIVVKKPKVQVWGGDLSTGGLVATSTSVKSLDGAQRTFGSWVEYGIFATGSITGTASGSAFAGPGLPDSTVCKYSTLSFANADSSACGTNTNKGYYTTSGLIANVVASFPGAGETILVDTITTNDLFAGGTYVGTRTGNLTLNTSEIAPGKSIILKVSGTVTIAGNQTYSNGPYTDISQLPQLIIIANKIIINSNVTRVDAWLIADGADGILETCNTGSSTFELNGDQRLTINKCKEQLTVNGPAMAKQLWLRRTYGSGVGPDLGTGAVYSGTPAEIFNLRADAYLWSAARASISGHIQTVYST